MQENHMLENIQVRTKILVTFVAISIIPLTISLFIASVLVERQLESEQRERLEIMSGLVESSLRLAVEDASEIGAGSIKREFLLELFGDNPETRGMEVAVYGPKGITTATRTMSGLALKEILGGSVNQTNIGGESFAVFSRPLDKDHGILVFQNRTGLIAALKSFQKYMFIVAGIVLLAAILFGLGISAHILRPIDFIGSTLKEMGQTGGDLRRDLPVRGKNEISRLAYRLNFFLAGLRKSVINTREMIKDVQDASDKIRQASGKVNEGTHRQSRALEENQQGMEGISESISGIAESTGMLLENSEASSSATMELGATIEQIAGQMEKLFGIVDEVTSSINEMTVTSQQVTDNVNVLASSTESTASSIAEMDASIKEVEENANQTNQLSEAAARDALEGKKAVEETIRGIGEIKEMVDRAAGVIQDLGSQSESIGKILTVIDEVADQTSLLALNAAIIAAQAGEHGRGFAVVANEIRELADRTAVSTREIASIIGNLQTGTGDAIRAMEAGSARVHEEVLRSRGAGEALEKIRASTLKSSEQVRGIVRATQEQSRGSRQITGSINQISAMLGEIASAVRQQTEGAHQLSKAAEVMRDIASQGKVGTGEQTKGSRQISISMDQIRTMVERIDEAIRALNTRSHEVGEAISVIRSIAEENTERTADLDQAVDILSQISTSMENRVSTYQA